MELLAVNMKQDSLLFSLRGKKPPSRSKEILLNEDSLLNRNSQLASSLLGASKPKKRFRFDFELLERVMLKQLEDNMNSRSSEVSSP